MIKNFALLFSRQSTLISIIQKHVKYAVLYRLKQKTSQKFWFFVKFWGIQDFNIIDLDNT